MMKIEKNENLFLCVCYLHTIYIKKLTSVCVCGDSVMNQGRLSSLQEKVSVSFLILETLKESDCLAEVHVSASSVPLSHTLPCSPYKCMTNYCTVHDIYITVSMVEMIPASQIRRNQNQKCSFNLKYRHVSLTVCTVRK